MIFITNFNVNIYKNVKWFTFFKLTLTINLEKKVLWVKVRSEIGEFFMASLKDVAQLAGVSLMTVSRALNNPDKL